MDENGILDGQGWAKEGRSGAENPGVPALAKRLSRAGAGPGSQPRLCQSKIAPQGGAVRGQHDLWEPLL